VFKGETTPSATLPPLPRGDFGAIANAVRFAKIPLWGGVAREMLYEKLQNDVRPRDGVVFALYEYIFFYLLMYFENQVCSF